MHCRLIAAVIVLALAVQAQAAERTKQKTHAQERTSVDLGSKDRTAPWLSPEDAGSVRILSVEKISRIAGLPKRTQFYEIDPEAALSGYFYYFYVRGKYNDYQVESVLKLTKLCEELEALEHLRHFDPGGEFFSGIGRGVAGIGVGVANIVTKPGRTMKSFGTRFGRMFKGTPKVGKDGGGANRSHLGEGPAGPERRRLAYKVGVDVYTDNPDLQHVLTGLSHARAGGGVASWAVPGSAIGLFQKTFRDEPTEKLIRDLSPSDMRIEIGKHLQPLLGMRHSDEKTPLGAFLHNPNFTPRQLAYVGTCLQGMSNVTGLQTVVQQLAHARTPEEADLLYMELRCHHKLHTTVRPIRSFVPLFSAFAAIDQAGIFTYVFPGDYLGPQAASPTELDDLVHAAQRAKGIAILSLGDVDARTSAEATARGIVITPNAFQAVSDKL